MANGRGNVSYKGYIPLFICICTNIEAVSDLTSAAFIAAYRRFVGRRGLPAHNYSDNGTNFIGATRILRRLHDDSPLKIYTDIIDATSKSNTEWHSIPPSSQHFGGLWVDGVKSVKYHLKIARYFEANRRTQQASPPNRCVSELSEDLNDIFALTPDHLLIGDALLAPDPCTEPTNILLISSWQLAGATIVPKYINALAVRILFSVAATSEMVSSKQTATSEQSQLQTLSRFLVLSTILV